MKKTNVLFIAIAIGCFSVVISSCKKSSNGGNPCSITMANLAGTYSLLKAEQYFGGVFIDGTGFLAACQKDDHIVLNANGTASYQDLGTACSPPNDATGTWALSGNVISAPSLGPPPGLNGTVSSYDCTKLVILDTTSGGDIYRITLTK